MRIWVTRPEDDGAAFAERLRAHGHEPVCGPLFTARFLPLDDLDPLSFDGLIATSRNAIRALAGQTRQRPHWLARPLVAVGPGTAEEGRETGFTDVRQGPGHAHGLSDSVPSGWRRILYLRGREISIDLAGDLAAAGHHVTSRIAYAMEPAGAPDLDLSLRLARGRIDAVTLFSPRAAAAYRSALGARGLRYCSSNLRHYCFSARVAEQLGDLQLGNLFIPSRPNLEEMLALIAGPAAQSVH